MRDQTAMKASASIHQLSFTAVLFAGIIVASTVLEFMAGQNSCPWLQLTQPLEGGEGSDNDMSFATSAVSPEHFTAQQSMSSLFDFEFETAFSTPIPPFPTHDASSQTLSFAEALHRTQIVDHGTEATNFNAETQPQYCSLDMLSNKSLPLRQRPVDEAEGFAFFDASETCSYYERGQMDSLPSRKIAGPCSTLLLTYGRGDHSEPLQSIEEDLPSSREQSIPLSPTETCVGDEEGSPCSSVIESDDSSIEDIEERKAFACPYLRLDPVRHIECLSHRRLSPEKQWHEIWKTLFNRTSPREGPYLGDSKEEIVGSMIAICKKGSSRVVPGILRSIGLPNDQGKAVQQLMEQLFNGFQALSNEESNDMETEKVSTCGGVDSIPMTPKDMEFDFTLPLRQSPTTTVQGYFAAKVREDTLDCSPGPEIQAWSPDHASFEGNKEKAITQDGPLEHSMADQYWAVGRKTSHCTETVHVPTDKDRWKSLGNWIPELDDEQDSKLWEYARGWKCHECGFEYIFRPTGVSSDKLEQGFEDFVLMSQHTLLRA
ncbi:hypothetical protein NOF04DRAFT_1346385 [Fusarium oxysporum II5]|nr:hypothetical protein NOF04DRAFT_1346385 [Fusarium oxysporum II5]